MLPLLRLNDTKRAIHDASVRVNRHAYAEVVGAVSSVAIEPGAVINVAIACREVRDGFWGLVNRIVVELI